MLFEKIEIGVEETEYGSKRYRVDKVYHDDGEVTYEYSFWLATASGKGNDRRYPLFFVSGSLDTKSYELQDDSMKESLWNALLDMSGVKKKN